MTKSLPGLDFLDKHFDIAGATHDDVMDPAENENDIEQPQETPDAPVSEEDSGEAFSAPPGSEDSGQTSQPDQRTEQPVREETDINYFANYAIDKEGNVVDQSGKIVAKRGWARRQFERARSNAIELQAAREQLTRANQQLQQTKQTPNSYDRYGLTEPEGNFGLQLVQAWKTDPVQATRIMLSNALQKGYNLQDIVGDPSVPGQDPILLGAVRGMMEQMLGPIRQEYDQRQQVQQMQQQEAAAYESLYSEYPAARIHHDVLFHMRQDKPGQSPREAFANLRAYAAQNGLDIYKPLAPQLDSRTRRTPNQSGRGAPMTPGRTVTGNANLRASNDSGTLSPTASTSDIVRSAMIEAGYKI